MENSVLVHEFGHGVSNRLIGGGTGACLISLEAQGLGEGWSDTLAELVIFTASSASQLLIILPAGQNNFPEIQRTSRWEPM